VEVEAGGRRIVLDAGLPLDPASSPSEELLPDVPGLWADGDGSLLAVFVTHGHADHHGLADLVTPGVPIYMGEAASAILNEAAFFVPSARAPAVAGTLRHRRPVILGPFTVTPWLVDHSGFDAYALLFEADGRRPLYTGDIRAHGRKHRTLEALAHGAGNVDALLMEGTQLSHAGGGARPLSEAELETDCMNEIQMTSGMALAFFSPQNVDRLVTLFKAARRARRTFVMDLYAASIAEATGRDTIPRPSWDGVRVYLPRSQKRQVVEHKAFRRTEAVREHRVYPEELADRPESIVMACRGSMLSELAAAGCLARAAAIWSMWPGYLERPSGARTKAELRRLGIPLSVHHTSGHASVGDLCHFASTVEADRLVPIHTDAPERFAQRFGNTELHPNNEWWAV
jgi:ribonuclease J